jgi:endonuclease/exonuclease/phosphatase family metal-dependent hydrolase
MKILSWNIERPQIDKKLDKNLFIINKIKEIDPDIIFLTETNSIIDFLSNYYKIQTIPLPDNYENNLYYTGENRVTIFSKYEFMDTSFKTYDPYTSVCGEIITPFGNLILYGSIIGSFGIVGSKNMEYFNKDFEGQQKDIQKLNIKENICYSGDFNMTFLSDYYKEGYPKKEVRRMNDFFKENSLINKTEQNNNCVIHIVLSKKFIESKNVKPGRQQIERHISDHDFVTLEIEKVFEKR